MAEGRKDEGISGDPWSRDVHHAQIQAPWNWPKDSRKSDKKDAEEVKPDQKAH